MSYPPDCCAMNCCTLAPWRAWTIEITVTVNRMRANIARVIPARKGRSSGCDKAMRPAGEAEREERHARDLPEAVVDREPPRDPRRPKGAEQGPGDEEQGRVAAVRLREIPDCANDVQAGDPPRREGDGRERHHGPRREGEDDARGVEVERDADPLLERDEDPEEVNHHRPEAQAREGPQGGGREGEHGPLEQERGREVGPLQPDRAGDA